MYIDSHCHLQHCTKNNLQEYSKIIAGQLTYLIDVSTNMNEILKMNALKLPHNVLLSYGLYPDQAVDFNKEMAGHFKEILTNNRPDAIGEIGIDYHRENNPVLQEKLFRYQIELSIELKLPLIIHSRDAFEDTFRILSEYSFNKAVILHCFGYGIKEAEEFLSRGFYISFAGNLTYHSADKLRQAAVIIPIEKILLETDSPYLSPMPHRGEENNPLNVKHTYQYFAKLRKIDITELDREIEKNFKKIFSI